MFMSKWSTMQAQRGQLLTLCMQCTGERQLGVVLQCDALDCRVNHALSKLQVACDDMESLVPRLTANALDW